VSKDPKQKSQTRLNSSARICSLKRRKTCIPSYI
jgi:hypothetical protein